MSSVVVDDPCRVGTKIPLKYLVIWTDYQDRYQEDLCSQPRFVRDPSMASIIGKRHYLPFTLTLPSSFVNETMGRHLAWRSSATPSIKASKETNKRC